MTSVVSLCKVSPSYTENAQVLPDVPKLDEQGIEAVDILEEVGLPESVEFIMKPVIVSWLNNRIVYHGRDSWKFNGAMGRLMLRTWLSPYSTREPPQTDRYKLVYVNTEAGIPLGGLEPARKSGLTDKRQELVEAINSGSAGYYGLFKRKFGVDVD